MSEPQVSPSDPLAPLPPPSLLDLSRQQRNLLLLRPLFQLELSKLRLGPEDQVSLFEGLDTHYLVLRALDFMMEGTTVSNGCTSTELIEKLGDIAQGMKPALQAAQGVRVAEVVVAALDNKAGGYKEFAYEYFEAETCSSRTFKFRLVRFEPDNDEVYRYRPTAEGYLVYLGMLDLPAEESQIMMEKMLEVLVKRGSFDSALQVARRARTLSLEYRQHIMDRLQQAYRAPGTVSWKRDLSTQLDQARGHVRQRQSEDQRMMESVSEVLQSVGNPEARVRPAQLLQILRSASQLRTQLVTDIGGAHEKFLHAQQNLFRARRPTGLPDLESQVLPQLVSVSSSILADQADTVLSGLYPPELPRLYDLNTVFSLLLEQRGTAVPPEPAPTVLEPVAEYPQQFSEALIQSVKTWLAAQFAKGVPYRIDELLDQAEEEGLSRLARRCLVFELFRAFSTSESPYLTMHATPLDSFQADVAQGTNLQFTPIEL